MQITRDEAVAWLHNPVTIAFRKGIENIAFDYKMALAKTCGVDQIEDNKSKGRIQGIEEAWDLENIVKEMYGNDDIESSGAQAPY